MIIIEKADRHRRCNCCNSSNDVHEILFRMDNHGTSVAICSDCMKELHEKISTQNTTNYIKVPRYGGKIDIQFEPNAMMGTVTFGDESFPVYLANMTVESFRTNSPNTFGKRKLTLIEI